MAKNNASGLEVTFSHSNKSFSGQTGSSSTSVRFYVEPTGHSVSATMSFDGKTVKATSGTLVINTRRVLERTSDYAVLSDSPYIITATATLQPKNDGFGGTVWWGWAHLGGELAGMSVDIGVARSPNDGPYMYSLGGSVGTFATDPPQYSFALGNFVSEAGGGGLASYHPVIDAAPVVTISKPVASSVLSTYVEIAGTASDYQGVLRVNYVITNAAGVEVKTGAANLVTVKTGQMDVSPNVVNWTTGELFLPPGTFTVSVIADDTKGHSSTPSLRTFSVTPSSLTAGDYIPLTPTLGYYDPYVSPPPKAFRTAISGTFEGSITKARLIAGNTVAGDNKKASGWWVASEITPAGTPVVIEPGGLSYYSASAMTVDAMLINLLGGPIKQPSPDGMLISPLILAAPPLLHPDGFALVYNFSMQFYQPQGWDTRGVSHSTVPLQLRLLYERKEPGSPVLHRLPSNRALLVDLNQGDMADIMALKSALIYPTSPSTFASGWTTHEPKNGPVDLTQQGKWNSVFSETDRLSNNLVSLAPGQVKPQGSGSLSNFTFVARNRPDDFIKPVASDPAMQWRQRDEEQMLDKRAVISLQLWAAVRPEIYGAAVVQGTNGTGAPVVGADRAAPVVKVTSPANGARINFVSTVTINGTASDAVGVTAVELRKESSTSWTPATITPAGAKNVTWTMNLDNLPAGLTTFYVRCRDAAGNQSAEVKWSLTLVRNRTLTIAKTGSGMVTVGFDPTSVREAGKTYTIVATPAQGWRFSKWEGSAIVANDAQSTTTFVMPDADVTLEPVFVTTTLPSLVGAYNAAVGISVAPDGTSAYQMPNDMGKLSVVVTPTGTFSGTLTLASQYPAPRAVVVFRLAGVLDGNDSYSTMLARTGKPPVQLSFGLGYDPSGRPVCLGSVKCGSNPRATFSGIRQAVFTSANPCWRQGRYPFRLISPTSATDLPLVPCDGWGTLSVDSLGRLSMVVRGPLQSAAVTIAGNVDEAEHAVVAASMTLGAKTSAMGVVSGYLTGALAFLANPDFGCSIYWLPLSAPTPAFSDDQSLGFYATGGLYVPPGIGFPMLQWTLNGMPNVVMNCWADERVSDVFKRLTMTANNTVQAMDPLGGSFTLKLDQLTGNLSGTVVIPGRVGVQSFGGVVLRNEDFAIGSFPGGFVRLKHLRQMDQGRSFQIQRRLLTTTASIPEAVVPAWRTASGVPVPTGPFSIATSVFSSYRPGFKQVMLRQGTAGVRGWQLVYDDRTQTVRCELSGPGIPTGTALSGTTAGPGLIVDVKLVAEPAPVGYTLKLYLSGVLKSSYNLPDLSAFQTTSPLVIADKFDGTFYFIRMWNRALSSTEAGDLLSE